MLGVHDIVIRIVNSVEQLTPPVPAQRAHFNDDVIEHAPERVCMDHLSLRDEVIAFGVIFLP